MANGEVEKHAAAGEDGLESRLTDIEIKLGFVDNLVDELNRTVYRQQPQLAQLQQALRELRRQVEADAKDEPGDPRQDLPPHY
jgi:SlyX protein